MAECDDYNRGEIYSRHIADKEPYDVKLEDNLAGADLPCADLRGVSLVGRDLRGACLCHVDLAEADLRGANLADVCAEDADFYYADLDDACFDGARLVAAYFGFADLSEASFAGAFIAFADFYRADLTDADFSRADGTRYAEFDTDSVYDAAFPERAPRYEEWEPDHVAGPPWEEVDEVDGDDAQDHDEVPDDYVAWYEQSWEHRW